LRLIPHFGHGAINGSFWPGGDDVADLLFPVTMWTNGTIVIGFQDLIQVHPFDTEAKRQGARSD
jgi:hypothetical protein